eukprot:TRINITY_DN688_c0_g1_i4.p1 TRINITY_DN688_c0_g1~~TRINITY_DN688_c0_g1_i4.p1  ORF type:complete len:252 (+),score=67.24 TRINITY_DN688_c0_g1_i4:59-814(+)
MSLTLHISGPLAGDGHVIEAQGKTKLADVKKQISSVIAIPVQNFQMVHGGEVMGDMNMLVSQTALCEGDEVVIEPSRRFHAGQKLRDMGVRPTVGDYECKVLESDMTDEEKAGIISLLVDYDPGFIRAGDVFKTKALHVVCMHGCIPAAEALLGYGADINGTDVYGSNPLLGAANNGLFHVVRFLLQHGADASHEDKNGRTALITAISQEHEDIVRLLLQHGKEHLPKVTQGVPAHPLCDPTHRRHDPPGL